MTDRDAVEEHDRFLAEEGLDLLSTFRAIKSKDARHAIMVMVAAVAQAEMDAAEAAWHEDVARVRQR